METQATVISTKSAGTWIKVGSNYHTGKHTAIDTGKLQLGLSNTHTEEEQRSGYDKNAPSTTEGEAIVPSTSLGGHGVLSVRSPVFSVISRQIA